MVSSPSKGELETYSFLPLQRVIVEVKADLGLGTFLSWSLNGLFLYKIDVNISAVGEESEDQAVH